MLIDSSDLFSSLERLDHTEMIMPLKLKMFQGNGKSKEEMDYISASMLA
jgi:hypothetical protein